MVFVQNVLPYDVQTIYNMHYRTIVCYPPPDRPRPEPAQNANAPPLTMATILEQTLDTRNSRSPKRNQPISVVV